MKKLKYVLFTILLFLINISIVSAKDDVINRIDVSITLDKYGNAHIEEIWDVKANMGTEFYKAEYNLGNMKISNFKVYENNRLFTFVNNWNVNGSLSEKAYKNGYNYTSNGIELCWGKGSMGTHTFKIVYDVSNFVFKTDDSDVLYWQVINQGMTSVPKKFTLTLSSFYSFPDTLDVWGFGHKGNTYVENGKIYMSNENNRNLKNKDYAVLLVKFPSNTFVIDNSNRYNEYYNFSAVLSKAEEGSFSYKFNFNAFLEKAKYILNRGLSLLEILFPYILFFIIMILLFPKQKNKKDISRKKIVKSYFEIFLLAFMPIIALLLGGLIAYLKIDPIILLNLFFIIIVFGIIFLLVSYSITGAVYKFGKAGRKIKEKDVKYYRDIPCQKNIFRAYFLSRLYILNKKPDDSDVLGAILLKWLFEDKIEIINDNEKRIFGKTKQIIFLKNNLIFDNVLEQSLYDILYYSSRDGFLSEDELKEDNERNFFAILFWFNKCLETGRDLYINDGLIYKNEQKYIVNDSLKEEALKLAGLKKYLTDFSMINQKLPIEVKLWKEYLIYAQIFGIADKVAEKFEKFYPDEISLINNDYGNIYFDYIKTINIFSSFVKNSAMSVISSSVNSRSSSRGGYSSGGGGFSSGGGGGGSFGGGGGGGR